MPLKSTNHLQLQSRNMLNFIINLSEWNTAFENEIHHEIPALPQGLPRLPQDPTPSLVDFHWLS